MLDVVSNSSISATYVMFDAYGGRVAAVEPSATAFSHRRAMFHVQVLVYVPRNQTERVALSEASDLSLVLRPAAPGAYRNYPSLDLSRNAKYAISYWGNNTMRLDKLKCRYDTHGLMDFRQSIPCAKSAR